MKKLLVAMSLLTAPLSLLSVVSCKGEKQALSEEESLKKLFFSKVELLYNEWICSAHTFTSFPTPTEEISKIEEIIRAVGITIIKGSSEHEVNIIKNNGILTVELYKDKTKRNEKITFKIEHIKSYWTINGHEFIYKPSNNGDIKLDNEQILLTQEQSEMTLEQFHRSKGQGGWFLVSSYVLDYVKRKYDVWSQSQLIIPSYSVNCLKLIDLFKEVWNREKAYISTLLGVVKSDDEFELITWEGQQSNKNLFRNGVIFDNAKKTTLNNPWAKSVQPKLSITVGFGQGESTKTVWWMPKPSELRLKNE